MICLSANRVIRRPCRRSFRADNIRVIPSCGVTAVKYAAGSLVAATIFMLSMEMAGFTNFIAFYEPADPDDPSAVTIKGVTVSLLSGEDNIASALGNYYQSGGGCVVWGILVSDSVGYPPIFGSYETNHSGYQLDIFGHYPDECRIYNGINSGSTPEEVEAAFGDDCIKTDNYYTEIFIDGREADYEKVSFPDEDESWDEWFERLCSEYPVKESCVVLDCGSYSEGTDIFFTVFDNTK